MSDEKQNPIPFFNRDDALEQIRRLNPLVGVRTKDIVDTGIDVVEQIAKQPVVTAKYFSQYLTECARIIGGRSTIKPTKGDSRYQDPAWHDNQFFKRAMQIHLVADQICQAWADENFNDQDERERAKFVLSLITETFSPPNSIFNPVLIKRIIETGGQNVTSGLQQLKEDTLKAGRLIPFQLPTFDDAFVVGETIGTTPTRPVFEHEQLKISQYVSINQPDDHPAPLLFIPSHLNRSYIFDLTPDSSAVRFIDQHHFGVYALDWTNPTPSERHWGLKTYLDALLEGLQAIQEQSGKTEIHLVGMGTGGIMALLTAAAIEQTDEGGSLHIASVTLIASVVGGDNPQTLGIFAGEGSVEAAKDRSDAAGILSGQDLSQLFTWLRPDAFTWTSRIAHYFTGQPAPNREITYWLEDTLNLPATLHRELLDRHQITTEPSDELPVWDLDEALSLDLAEINTPIYAVAGSEDYINPWQFCYASIREIESEPRFTLSSGDLSHLILNLPDQASGHFYTNTDLPRTPTAWKETGLHNEGSWWNDWLTWVSQI